MQHFVIVHHIDGESSILGAFEDRTQAILEAAIAANELDEKETVSACGYSWKGNKLRQRY